MTATFINHVLKCVIHCYLTYWYIQIIFRSNGEYTTEEKAAWPLDHVHAGIKATTTAKFFIQCYKIQVQDYVVSKCSQLSAS